MNLKFVVLAISLSSLTALAAPNSKIKARRAAAVSAPDQSSTSTSAMTMPRPAANELSPKGIRFSVFKPVLNMKVKDRFLGDADSSLDNTFGVSFGYANLPYKQLGWTANATYIEIFESGEKIGLVRADGNIAYGFEKSLSIKGGLNLGKFLIPNRIRDEYNPNIGAQASVGLQMTKNVGIDAGYTYMKHTNSNQEILLTGMELGLHGTF